MTTKTFHESGRTAVFTTKFVITDKNEITYVTHEKDDGAWQFFSNDKFDNFEDVVQIVALDEILKIDPTISELADLPLGFSAQRNFKGDTWIRREIK